MTNDDDTYLSPEMAGGYRSKEPRKGKGCMGFFVFILLMTVIGMGVVMFLSGWSIADLRAGLMARINPFASEIQDSFRAETLRIASTNGNELTLATHERQEVFTRDSVVKFFEVNVPFSDRKTEVTFPATYRYHVMLNDEWGIETQNQTVVIRAPDIRPTLPVAFDSGKVHTNSKGWLIFEGRKGIDEEALKVKITERLNKSAASDEMIDAVRDECRDSLAKFVQNWLMREEFWRGGQFTEIKVLFPDEADELLGEMDPIIELESLQPEEIPAETQL